MRVITVVCLSHFKKTAAKSPLHVHLDRVWFSSLSLSHTQPQEEKNPNYCQTPRSVSREEGKGERLGRTPLVLACPNHGFSALEGRSRSSGPIYRQGSREQCHELVMELRERFSPNARSCALKAAALIWLAQNTQSAGFLMHCALLLSPSSSCHRFQLWEPQ